ncbi:MAG TPA: hypothetical protein VIF88_02030 [Methylocystis sp.]|jgi:hypothetical protein
MMTTPNRPATDDLPAWVPALVEDVARRLPPSEIVDRLLTDDRMKIVWRSLMRQTPNDAQVDVSLLHDPRIKIVWRSLMRQTPKDTQVDVSLLWRARDTPLGLTRDVLYSYPAGERGCAAFFVGVVDVLAEPPSAMTRVEYDAEVRRFADAAELCRTEHAAGMPHEALAIVADYFARKAMSMKTTSGLHIVERSGGERSDDALRVQARHVAAESFALYGQRNCGTVAKALSVATGVTVSKGSIENWTHDVPKYFARDSQ